MQADNSNVFSLSRELERRGDSAELLYRLAAIGINKASRGYDDVSKSLVERFASLDNKVVLRMWNDLDESIKLGFINRNSDLILEWLENAG